MASGKAAGPSIIVAEMLKPVGEAGAVEVRDLIEDIILEGCIPTNWQESFIVNLYKGKGDALNRGNYRGLKLIEQVMKCWSVWCRDSSGKELRSMRCSVASCLAVALLRAGCDHTLQMCMGQVRPIASPSHQPPSAPSDQR